MATRKVKNVKIQKVKVKIPKSGILLAILLTWLLLSPAFKLRKFFQGEKQGLLTLGGLCLTFSFFFGIMRNVMLSVALGYHSASLCLVPQLLTAIVHWICKAFADKDFRCWSLGDQVMHVLIGSLVPGLTRKSEAETEPGKGETQDESSVAGTQDPDLQESELEESRTTSHQSEEPNEIVMIRRTVSNELTAIFLLHALNVVLGAIFFRHLHETSTEFVAVKIKVKEACSMNLPLAVYIGCPVALLASFFFRLLHSKFGPSRAIRQDWCSCSAICPPASIHQTFVDLYEKPAIIDRAPAIVDRTLENMKVLSTFDRS